MSVNRSSSMMALVLLPVLAVFLHGGCGLTVTQDRPSYDDLDPEEQSAVDIVISELLRLNAQIKQRTPHNINEIVDKERIHVSFEGLIFSGTLGDDVIHLSIWENLGQQKQDLIGSWFETGPEKTRQTYVKLFYRFLAVVQGVKQFMYKVLTPEWVFEHRTLWSLERDTIRTALSHFKAEGRKPSMWPFLTASCRPVLKQYEDAFDSKFTKKYLQRHFAEIYDPEDPSGYMYFICRWIEMGQEDAEDEPLGLTGELNWLMDLPNA